MTWLKRIIFLLLGLAIAGGLFFIGLTQGWFTPKQTPQQLASIIEPHLNIFKPAQEGPYPTLLMFHGCGGDEQQQQYWGEKLSDLGYAAISVDSYTGRNIDFERAISHVCQGKQLIGAERAGDVLTALAWANQQAWIDQDNIHLVAWSHGAWSVMDAFALHAKKQIPHGLTELPKANLAQINKTVLFYPYCGFGVKSNQQGWTVNTDILAIDTAVDTVVGTRQCDTLYQALRDSGSTVQHEIFTGVDHAFDTDAVRTGDNWEYRTPRKEAQAAAEKARLLVAEFLAQ